MFVFIEADPTFAFVLHAYHELRREQRLVLHNIQEARVNRVKGSNGMDELLFGNFYGFARTYALCARVCMVRATGMNVRRGWFGNDVCYRRNVLDQNNFVFTCHHPLNGPPYRITANAEEDIEYFSKYDQLYPHFLIRAKCQNQPNGHQISLPSMMLIFSQDFTEVVEITTTATITDFGGNNRPGRFHGYINVLCHRCTIQDRQDGQYIRMLRATCTDWLNIRNPQLHPQNDGEDTIENVLNRIRNLQI